MSLAGAELNVVVGYVQLGGEAAFVTALPEHGIADGVLREIRGLGVETGQVVRSAEGRLGLFFLEAGSGHRAAQVIYDREGSVFSRVGPGSYDWDGVFAGAGRLHLSGVTPAISRNAAEVAMRAVEEAGVRGVPVSFDMNFRRRLWQWEPGKGAEELAAETVRGLMPGVELFIGGPDDVAMLTGEPEAGKAGHAAAARLLVSRWPNVKRVAMTMRESITATRQRLGGMLYEAEGDVVTMGPVTYEMTEIADRLGGGDAFAAGLLTALDDPELREPEKAVAFAVAASCLAHTVPGDFALVSRGEVETLMRGGGGGRVVR
jgi:2-dehydro-3-deoxygluconokinase